MPPPPVYAVNPQPGQEHTHTVIILHGRDSSSEEFAREFFECEATVTTTPTEHTTTECDNKEPAPSRTLVASLFPNCRWVFPGAPLLLSERFGLDLCQWFDMWSTENPEERVELQEPGLRSSVTALLRIVHHEAETVPRGRIALGGISQGSVTALAAFLADTAELAGFFGFCAWMPPLTVVAELMNSHGTGMGQSELLRSLFIRRQQRWGSADASVI